MYLSFTDYQNMGGTLEKTAFDDLVFEAESVIDWYTFGRLKNEEYDDLAVEVKKCMYHIIKLINDKHIAMQPAIDSESDTSGGVSSIASQSNDGVSISYNVLSASEALDSIKNEVEDLIKKSLSYVKNSLGRKVLYRGLYQGE